MNKYLLIDLSNAYARAKFATNKQTTMEDMLGFCLHTSFGIMAKPWQQQKCNHIIVFLEGRSWRKDFYSPYKKNREVAKMALTEAEVESNKLLWANYDELVNFLHEKTNVTCLQHPVLEADDLIAGWIQSHPNDQHCIVSSDSDFYQLIAPNITQYNGITDETITLEGFVNYKGNKILDKKTKQPKIFEDPKWILFEKIMRGDSTDNVFSAFPGVRTKGSSKKVGLQEAYFDKDSKGFAWNNMMLQKWTSHDGTDHRVLDDYKRNEILIDLTKQPPEIRAIIDDTISNTEPKDKAMIGAQFLKFCGKHQLIKLSEQATKYAEMLSAPYKKSI